SLFRRLATLALRLRGLPSPQVGLTSVFGMRTGVTQPPKHQNRKSKDQNKINHRTCLYVTRRLVNHKLLRLSSSSPSFRRKETFDQLVLLGYTPYGAYT